MTMVRGASLLLLLVASAAGETDKISNYELGAKWSGKCIKITDWNSKNYDEDLEVLPREANGCCPADYIPGASAHSAGQGIGPQVICGIASDAVNAFTMSTSNNASTCSYGDCYVVKNVQTCKDDSTIGVNGCCGVTATTAADLQWPALCTPWNKLVDVGNTNDGGKWCSAYATTYANIGTAVHTDNIADEKLVFSGAAGTAGHYYWTPCSGSGIPPDTTSSGGGGGSDADRAPKRAATGALGLAALGAAMLS